MRRERAIIILDEIDDHPFDEDLTIKEASFIDSLMKKYDQDPNWHPSDKQAAWLEDIYDRLLS